jgi:hypothetical protein
VSGQVGFCSKCGLVRNDDEYGWPVTPCACFVEHHEKTCQLRRAIGAMITIACVEHGMDSCPDCNPCSCGVPTDRAFVWAKHVFEWELGVGLMPTTRL